MKFIKNIVYFYWYFKLKLLEEELSNSFFNEFKNTKRLTLWYIAGRRKGYSDSIDYAFYKVYDIWGVDSLTNEEKKGF